MSTKLSYLKASKFITYNPLTGNVTRVDRINGNPKLDKDGYLVIKIKSHLFKVHRLCWAKHYQKEPILVIDHINRNKTDNRVINLRHVSQKQNILNTHREPNKDTGYVGIYKDKTTKGLKAKFTTKIDGKTYRFRVLQEAVELRLKNKRMV